MHTPVTPSASARLLLALAIVLAGTLASCRGAGGRSAGHSVAGFGEHAVVGIDVSAHNGDIDWAKVKAAGVEFAIIKATEGGSFQDRRYIDNIRLARQAGLKVGAYHFFRFDTPGYVQALNFTAALHGRALDLPAAIDIEEWANTNLQATHLVMERLAEMTDHLERHGYRVMLYTNKKGHTRFIDARTGSFPLWICSLGTQPQGIDCVLWQATHHGRIDGIDHDVDINVFTGGGQEDWREFAGGIMAQ